MQYYILQPTGSNGWRQLWATGELWFWIKPFQRNLHPSLRKRYFPWWLPTGSSDWRHDFRCASRVKIWCLQPAGEIALETLVPLTSLVPTTREWGWGGTGIGYKMPLTFRLKIRAFECPSVCCFEDAPSSIIVIQAPHVSVPSGMLLSYGYMCNFCKHHFWIACNSCRALQDLRAILALHM